MWYVIVIFETRCAKVSMTLIILLIMLYLGAPSCCNTSSFIDRNKPEEAKSSPKRAIMGKQEITWNNQK